MLTVTSFGFAATPKNMVTVAEFLENPIDYNPYDCSLSGAGVDNDWNTWEYISDDPRVEYKTDFRYRIPFGARSAVWTVKDAGGTNDIQIPYEAMQETDVYIKAYYSQNAGEFFYYVYYDYDWHFMFESESPNRGFYEEQMQWSFESGYATLHGNNLWAQQFVPEVKCRVKEISVWATLNSQAHPGEIYLELWRCNNRGELVTKMTQASFDGETIFHYEGGEFEPSEVKFVLDKPKTLKPDRLYAFVLSAPYADGYNGPHVRSLQYDEEENPCDLYPDGIAMRSQSSGVYWTDYEDLSFHFKVDGIPR